MMMEKRTSERDRGKSESASIRPRESDDDDSFLFPSTAPSRCSHKKVALLPKRERILILPAQTKRGNRKAASVGEGRKKSRLHGQRRRFSDLALSFSFLFPVQQSTHRELFLDASSESMDPLDPLAPMLPGKPPPRPSPTARRGPPASSPSPSRMPEAASAWRFL